MVSVKLNLVKIKIYTDSAKSVYCTYSSIRISMTKVTFQWSEQFGTTKGKKHDICSPYLVGEI